MTKTLDEIIDLCGTLSNKRRKDKRDVGK